MAKPNNKEANIRSYYTEVNKFGQNGEYDKAIKSLNKSKWKWYHHHTRTRTRQTFQTKLTNLLIVVLNVEPEDPTAIQCKVVCLIQSSKFSEAIQFIERTKSHHLAFERAYCEYRLNTPERALKTIDAANISPLPPKLKELRAQVLYRLERFDECFDAYRDIIKNSNDDYEDERAANLSAVAANLAFEGSVRHRVCIRNLC